MGELLEPLADAPSWIRLSGGVVVVVVLLVVLLKAVWQGSEAKLGPLHIGARPNNHPRQQTTPGSTQVLTPGVDHEQQRASPMAHGTDALPRRVISDAWRRHAVVDHDKLLGVGQLVDDVTNAVEASGPLSTVSLFGDGGIGKTAVAFDVAERCATSGAFSRVAWVSAKSDTAVGGKHCGQATAGPAAAAQISDVVPILAGQLGAPLALGRALWPQAFADYVSTVSDDERILTVLDNVENVGEGEEAVAYLHDLGLGHPHRILVTTRWSLAAASPRVTEFQIHRLSDDEALALALHFGRGNRDLLLADRSTLQPIIDVTEGNPYLIKLVISHFLESHRSLEQVVDELTSLGHDVGLAEKVRSHLYLRSIDELRRRVGESAATALMAAFCTKRRGEAFTYAELEMRCRSKDDGHFREVLQTACELALVTATNLHERYAIHSLLHEYTCRTS